MFVKRKIPLLMVITGFLGVVGVLGREPILALLVGENGVPSRPPEIRLLQPEEIARPHLTWAEQECQRAIFEHLKPIDLFFADCKKHTRAFAEEAIGWGSKWRLLVDYVPFTGGGSHEAFLRERFEQHVFGASQLEEAVKQVVASYLQEVESIEGRMLVRIRADVAGFPSDYPVGRLDDERVRLAYNEIIAKAIKATGKGLPADLSGRPRTASNFVSGPPA